MEEIKHITLGREQVRDYAAQAVTLAHIAYEIGDDEQAAEILGMCEECVGEFFDLIGVNDLDEGQDFYFDIDRNNNITIVATDTEDEPMTLFLLGSNFTMQA